MVVEDLFQIGWEDSLPEELAEQDPEFLFPFLAMGTVMGTIFRETVQVRDFVCEGDQESIRIQVVVDRDPVSLVPAQWAVVPELGAAHTRYLEMDVAVDDPTGACTDRFCRKVFRKYFFDGHGITLKRPGMQKVTGS